MRAFEAVADQLAAEGVTTMFGLMGDGNMDLMLETTGRHGIGFVKVRHEQGAVAMADGYARASGDVGVATTTCGPGLLNTATSLGVARAHGSAVVLLAGDTPLGDPGHLQSIDQDAFGEAVAGVTLSLRDPGDARRIIAEAFALARGGSGPVLVNLPMDMQAQEIGDPSADRGTTVTRDGALASDVAVRADELDAAVAALQAASRPLIVAGRGALAAGAQVTQLAERLDAPFVTTLQATGLAAGHPLGLGNAGLAGTPGALELLEAADCIVAVGASLHRLTTAFGRATAGATVIRIDRAPAAADPSDVCVRGDAADVLEQLIERVDARPAAVAAAVAQAGYPFTPDHGTDTVDPRSAFVALDRALPEDDRTLVVDAGHFISIVGPLVRVPSPESWIFPTDLGCIGQTVAASAGVAEARPGRRVTVVAGDGGFMMGIAELETAGRYGWPVTFFVINDGAWGQEAHVLRLKGQPEDLARAATPDLARLAEAYGVAGYSIKTPADLDGLSEVLARTTGPLVVDVRVNPTVPNWVIETFGLDGHDIRDTVEA